MKYIFWLLLSSMFNCTVKSQTAEDSIKATIQGLFTAMQQADGAAAVASFADSAVMQTIGKAKDGSILVVTDKVAAFGMQISAAPMGALDERISFEVIKVDGPLAIVWTPYQFYYNGTWSHCGVNSFQLLRTAKGWKIQYIIYTRRKIDCK
ncbi:MAG: hypothetical protein WD135_08340 [Ferruginibacter sp.]